MDLIKISFLLFSAGLHATPRSSTIVPWSDNTRKMDNLPNDPRNCICFPDGPLPTPHQILDSQNTGQQRVVIYLYKNDGSNEIKMYTPNAQKQMLIPDIPYEFGDLLDTVNPDNINTLFYNNPNKIRVYDNHLEGLSPTVTDSLPIGLDEGSIEHIFPGDGTYMIPNYNGNEYNLALPQLIENVPERGVTNRLPQGLSSIIPEYNFVTQEIKGNIPDADIINQQPQGPLIIPGYLQETEISYPNWPPHTVDNRYISLHSLNDHQAIPVNPQIWPNRYQNDPKRAVFPDFGFGTLVQSDNLQHIREGELEKYLVYTFSITPRLDSQDLNNNLSSIQIVAFDVWFKQQLERIRNVQLPNDRKSINSNALKILVERTLADNNIHVRADGVIIDSTGAVIDGNNLELRPLFLGEKIDNQAWQSSQGSIQLPKNLAYLEGILVSLVSPPHILGIIPLGKIYLPETPALNQVLTRSNDGRQIYLNYQNPNPLIPINYASGVVTQLPYEIANWNPSEKINYGNRRKLTGAKIEHHIKPPVKNKKTGGTSGERANSPNESDSIEVEPGESTNSSESGRKLSLPSVALLKMLLNVVDSSYSRSATKSGDGDILSDAESINGGGPDFRIIGGSAATGSGTPLSNKGRSGYTESD